MTEEEILEKNIKAVILDGVDKIYEGSSDVLRKSLVKNAARSGSVIQDSDTVRVSPLDWKVRNKIYDRIINPFVALRANRFLITHMKPVYEGIGAPIAVSKMSAATSNGVSTAAIRLRATDSMSCSPKMAKIGI